MSEDRLLLAVVIIAVAYMLYNHHKEQAAVDNVKALAGVTTVPAGPNPNVIYGSGFGSAPAGKGCMVN